MASEWFYQVMGEQVGPISSDELRELAKHRRVTRDTPVRKAPDGDWVLAERVQGLFAVPNQTPRPMPVSVNVPPPPPPGQRKVEVEDEDAAFAFLANQASTSSVSTTAVRRAKKSPFGWFAVASITGIGALVVLLVLVLVPSAMGQEKKTGAAAYDDFKEPYRTQFIEKWKQAVENAKRRVAEEQKELTKASREGTVVGGGPDADGRYPDPEHAVLTRVSPKSPTGRAYIQKKKTSLADAKRRLAELKTNDPPFISIPVSYLPDEPRDWRPGNTGSLGRNVKLVQVVDKDRMLIVAEGLRGTSKKVVMLSGFPTEGRVDGEILSLDEPIEITGTTTYTAVNGSTTTVLKAVRAKPFDRESYINSLKRGKP